MFPFQRSCELSFKINDNDIDEQDGSFEVKIEDLENYELFGSSNLNQGQGRGLGHGRGRGRGRGRKSRLLASTSNTSNIDEVEEEKRREIHRQNERQRRQKMATLFESLRSVIPNDHLKGRKTIIDHLEEATNYIKDLEKNIKELKEKRDELKQSTEPTSSSRDQLGASSDPTRPNSVVISQIVGGFDIEIRAKDDEYMLSTAIQVAFEEGLHVVSSTSSKLHGRFIHSIQCEVSDVTCVDLKQLEQRLNDLSR